jgi:amino acid adenylation domain-containing protein/non-ribosomal peptide synthase protein (TIGR01720 family)
MSPGDDRQRGLSVGDKRKLLARLLRQKASQSRSVHPLSPAQRAIWLLQQFEPQSTMYHVASAFRVLAKLNTAALGAAVQHVVDHHAILRSTYHADESGPVLEVRGGCDAWFAAVDASGWDEEELSRQVQERSRQPFDLENGPILRVHLFTKSEADHVVLFTTHHIACDGWSLILLAGEYMDHYQAECAGEPIRKPPGVEYTDYIRQQAELLAGPAGAEQAAYWLDRLKGPLPQLQLPTDRPRSMSTHGSSRLYRFPIEAPLYAKLAALGRAEGTTLFAVLLAGYQALLSRYTGEEDILIGSPMAARSRPEYERTIGHFVNLVVLRGDLSGGPSFRQLLARAWQELRGALRHQDYPFSQLVQQLRPGTRTGRSALFQVEINLLKEGGEALKGMVALLDRGTSRAPLPIEPYPVLRVEERHDLILTFTDTGRDLVAQLQYDADLFDLETIQQFGRCLVALLTHAADCPETKLSKLVVLSPADRAHVMSYAAVGAIRGPSPSVTALFDACVERTPEAIAIVFGQQRLTFAELSSRANQVAHLLRRLGVGPGQLVGLCIERSPEMVVGLLAILKAGAAYVPLDPGLPPRRLAYLIEDARAGVVVTRSGLRDCLPQSGAHTVCLDDVAELSRESTDPPVPLAGPGDLAYVLYTSGSTGLPKGVMVEHHGLSHYLSWCLSAYPAEGGSPLHTSISFDLSLTSLLVPLISGQRLLLTPPAEGAEGLAAALRDQGPFGLVKLTPAHLRLLPTLLTPHEAAGKAGAFVIGGEALTAADVAFWREHSPSTALYNEYGPTEAVVGCCVYRAPEQGALPPGAIPIGTPIPDTRLYVLDRHLQPVPAGVVGELYIGGTGLARGYLRRPRMTAERFVPDPFRDEPGSRMYRTGDLARYLPNGDLDYLGRRDDQVKIRGFRVELGEIEAALGEHPGVREAVVLAREDRPGERRLVGYVVLRPEQVPDAGELRRFLKTTLPEYMVPGVFVFCAELPLTPHGKVDRKALPAPEEGQPERGVEHVAPRTPAEQALAEIWAKVLRLERVGVHDNFFELGGDSILGIQVLSRARAAGLPLPAAALFRHPTIAELAAAVAASSTPAAAPEAKTGPVPLTPIQHWFFEQGLAEPHYYNQAALWEVRQPLSPSQWSEVLAHLHQHHDALRLRFSREDGGWVQKATADATQALEVLDLSAIRESEHSTALAAAGQRIQASLDLTHGPLLQALLVRRGPGRPDCLMLVLHHLIVDGVSWRILQEDLELLAGQALRGERLALPPATTSYPQWAQRLATLGQSDALKAERDHWLKALQGRRPTPLPLDNPSGANIAGSVQVVTVGLDAEETRALLQEVPGAYRTQVNDVLLTALAEAFAQWAGSRSLWLTLEGHGREDLGGGIDVSRTVGWFTTLFPVLLDLAGVDGRAAALKAVKEQLRQVPGRGLGHGTLRYLSADAELRASLRDMPQPQVRFNYLGQFGPIAPEALLSAPQPAPGALRSPEGTRSHVLEVDGVVAEGQLFVSWAYSSNLHRSETIRGLAAAFLTTLRGLITHCQAPSTVGYTPSDFPLAGLTQAQLDQLAAEDGNVEDVYPLTPTQQGVLFHSLASENGDYFLQVVLRFRGRIDEGALTRAWQQIVDRHAGFRARVWTRGVKGPLQVVERQATVTISRHDWRVLPEAERPPRLQELLQADRRQGFDLAQAPLMRVALVREEEEVYQLVWSHHHLVSDGWSTAVILNEVLRLYEANLRGAAPLARPRPYRDYVAWLRQQDQARAEQFWREELRGLNAPTPLGIDRPGRERDVEKDYAEHVLRLSPALAEGLRNLARSHHLTLNTLLQGAWALLLSRYSGQNDVLFGVTMSGRPPELAGVETMVGLFINTLPVRARLGPQDRLVPWLQALQERQARLRDFEHSPLFDVQRWSDMPRNVALFDSILVFENYPVEAPRHGRSGADVDAVRMIEQTNYRLTLVAVPGANFKLKAMGDRHAFEAGALPRLLGHLEVLLHAMTAQPSARLSELPILPASERQQLLVEWNQTAATLPPSPCLHHLIEEQVARTPGRIAVTSEAEQVTYAELNHRATRLARHLRALGCPPGSLVGICAERSVEMVVGLLAVLKAGAAYVPIDPEQPVERLEMMLRDAAVAVLLTQRRLQARLPECSIRVVCLDTDAATFPDGPAGEVFAGAAPNGPAYMIYTSGSTGRPKGALNSHRAICNRLLWMQNEYRLGEDDVVLQKTPYSFDVSVWELFWPLLAGARLVMARPGGHRDPEYLAEVIAREKVTTLHFVPPMLETFLHAVPSTEPCGSVRRVICSGEALPFALQQRFYQRMPWAALHNLYGPTEAAVDVTYWECERSPTLPVVPIGRPVANTRIYVLDRAYRPVPVGAPGELFIGGIQVGMGYWQRPGLTAEKFVPDPFGGPGERLYRTGDLTRWLPNGAIEYLGRMDHQVKLRGFRIELGEIETVLAQHPLVREVVLLAREDRPGEKQLVAYLVPRENTELSPAALRAHVAARLPEYMVPAAFVALSALPVTANGKVDRRALPAPDRSEPPREQEHVPPRTPTEQAVAGIWSEVLGVARVGAQDNFFELGGHSLSATLVLSRLQDVFQVKVPMRSLFEARTVRELAEVVEKARRTGTTAAAPAITRASREGRRVRVSARGTLEVPEALKTQLGGKSPQRSGE